MRAHGFQQLAHLQALGLRAGRHFRHFPSVAAIHWLMQRSPWAAWVRTLNGVVPLFINIIGVLFGLTLTFLANDIWKAHDRAMNAVYKEADALRSLVVIASQLEEPQRSQLREALTDYAEATVGEWALLAQRKSSPEVSSKADRLLVMRGSTNMAKAAGDNVQALMLRKVTDMRDDGDQCIGLSQTNINPLKWLGMAFLDLLTRLSAAVVHAENPPVAFAAAAAPTAAIIPQ